MTRVIVTFAGDEVPDDVQALCMFELEVALRERSGMDCRVFKQRMADDSKLRVLMDARRAGK